MSSAVALLSVAAVVVAGGRVRGHRARRRADTGRQPVVASTSSTPTCS